MEVGLKPAGFRALAGLGVALLGFFGASVPAAEAAKPVGGKLSNHNFTVIALAGDGGAASAQPKPNGRFRLRPPAKQMTLHLRADDGTYAGPVVIEKAGKKGRSAILGVGAGAELGSVTVRRGYAKLDEELDPAHMVREIKAKARKGVPIGVGSFGRVASQPSGVPGPGQDLDRDGIPGALDIDDDGDLVLDGIDASATPTAQTSAGAGASGAQPASEFGIRPGLGVTLAHSANSNAGSGDAEIEALLPNFGGLTIEIVPGGPAELDCAGDPLADPPRPGLRYCSPDGTGMVNVAAIGPPDMRPFPGPLGNQEFDSDRDGFGTLFDPPFPPGGFFSLQHGAVARRADLAPTVSQIGSGDLLAQRVETPTGEVLHLSTVPFVFASAPDLISYTDTAGNSGPVNDSGGDFQEFPVAAGSDGNVVVTLTFFRAQRRPVPKELCPPPDGPECASSQWIDIGGMRYGAVIRELPQKGPGGACPQSAFTSADPNELTPTEPPGPFTGPGLTDRMVDHVASGDMFTYQLNLTECLAGAQWGTGEVMTVDFTAHPPSTAALTDVALSGIRFKLE